MITDTWQTVDSSQASNTLMFKKNKPVTPNEIIKFWYSENIAKQWFSATPQLDAEIRKKYQSTWEKALAGELDNWCADPDSCLALVILLDQFPLNMFRGQAKSFSSEQKAVETAWHAIKQEYDADISQDKLAFLYMPFMHSEDLTSQDLSVSLFKQKKLDRHLGFAEHHREIIRKFGRFPHRNKILGRTSTREELEYLASDKAFTG